MQPMEHSFLVHYQTIIFCQNTFLFTGLSATEIDKEGNRGQSVSTEVTIIVSVSTYRILSF